MIVQDSLILRVTTRVLFPLTLIFWILAAIGV